METKSAECKKILLPREFIYHFKANISASSVFEWYSTLIYWVVSSGLTLFLVLKNPCEIDSSYSHLVYLIPSVIVAITLMHFYISKRFNDFGVTNTKTLRWNNGEFRKWQVNKVKSNLEKDGKEELLGVYKSEAEKSLAEISPFITPAIILSFVIPTYTIVLTQYVSFAKDLTHLYNATLLLAVIFLMVVPIYIMGSKIISFLNNERVMLKELCEILTDIEFEKKQEKKLEG